MIAIIAYILAIILEIAFAIGFTIYTIFLIYSNLKGSPYVPTKAGDLDAILKAANLKKGKVFIDLGCGDGRVVRKAVAEYGVKGIGVDVNPLLLARARLQTKIGHLKNIEFNREDILKTDISKADVIYVFLMPGIIAKLTPRFEKETKKSLLVISRGFKVPGWEKKLIKTVEQKPFPSYFYKKDL